MALTINGYGSLASTNSKRGNRSDYVTANNQEFAGLDKNNGDNFGAIGAAVGFGTDVGVQVISNVVTGKPFYDISVGQALGSAALGATGVGIANVIGKGAKDLSTARQLNKAQTLVVQQAAGVAADATTSVVTKTVRGEEVTVKGVGVDVLAGQLGGVMGSKFAKSKATSSQTYKDLNSKADRAKRMANPSKANGTPRRIGRPEARQRNAAITEAVKKSFVHGAEERGGIVGGGAAGGLVEIRKTLSADRDQENK